MDGSISAHSSASLYNYERNLAILLSLTLPVNASNPMFAVKYSNYAGCRSDLLIDSIFTVGLLNIVREVQ